MASVNKDSKGRVRIQFKTGRRHTLRLGREISKKAADEIGRHIDRLIEARRHGMPVPSETAKWVDRLPNDLRMQLVQMEVIEDSGSRAASTLGGFLKHYIDSRTDMKASTRCNLETAKRWLIKYFGEKRELDSITPLEAEAFRAWLESEGGQAPNTVKRLCSRAKQFFRAALRGRLVRENPFHGMKRLIVGRSHRSRIRFIDEATAQRVLAACPDAHWRVIFALARYGGMRMPSEACALKWSDIDWENSAILLPCPKTEDYEGRETRLLPLFPELRQELEIWQREAPEGSEFVLKPAVNPKTNLRTGLIKILKRAGIQPWPKLFQNLRSTRATELRDKGYREQIVAEWLGHTVKVADDHYDQVTAEHFRRAVGAEEKKDTPTSQGAA